MPVLQEREQQHSLTSTYFHSPTYVGVRKEADYQIQVNPTHAEVGRLHSAEIPTSQRFVEPFPGLGRDSVLTEETGFVLRLEMKRFFGDLNFALSSGRKLAEALKFAVDELEVNIRTYNLEFIKSKTVLPHQNRFDVVDGVLRMVGNNGRPLLDAISSKERRGLVLQASRTIESYLLAAPPNSFAVMMSPDGWSGYADRNGQGHNHLNCETLIFWKNQQGILRGLTLVTDLKQDQTVKVMSSLGVSEQVLGGSEEDRLANIVKNPALLSFPRSDITPFEYVLDKILAVRGRGQIRLLQKDGAVEIRSVEQTRADIKRFDELLLFDQKEEELIASLREFILGRIYQLGEKDIQDRIVREIERTVLSLAGEHLRKNPTVWKVQHSFPQGLDNFGPEIAFLQSRAGCPTGGSSVARTLGGSSLGAGVLTLESDQYGSLEFECPKCNKTNRRPKGQLIPHCQHCEKDVRC